MDNDAIIEMALSRLIAAKQPAPLCETGSARHLRLEVTRELEALLERFRKSPRSWPEACPPAQGAGKSPLKRPAALLH